MLCSIAGCWPGCSTHRSLTPLLAGHASCHKCEALIERGIAVEICTTDLSTQINPLADPPHDATAKLIYYTLIAAYHVDGWGGGQAIKAVLLLLDLHTTLNKAPESIVVSRKSKSRVDARSDYWVIFGPLKQQFHTINCCYPCSSNFELLISLRWIVTIRDFSLLVGKGKVKRETKRLRWPWERCGKFGGVKEFNLDREIKADHLNPYILS